MLTREQIEEIRGEAWEKGIAIKALLKERGIPEPVSYTHLTLPTTSRV